MMSTQPIPLHVRRGTQIVTPLRFVRMRSGELMSGEPDLDDRGFAMGSRPHAWGTTDARGAMIGITQGQTVRMAVLREDIGDDAPLFVTVEPKDLVKLESPLPGQPLGGLPTPVGQPHDVIVIRGLKDVALRCGKIQVRFGSPSGPVLSEIECHIFALKEVRVIAWLVTILGIGPNLGLPPGTSDEKLIEEIANDFAKVNRIFEPAGIVFNFQSERTKRFSIDRTLPGKKNRPFKWPGKVNDKRDADWEEFSSVVNTKYVKGAINVYFVHRALGYTAAAIPPSVPRKRGYGIVVSDAYKVRFDPPAPEYVLAHELGHFLEMEHPDEVFDPTKKTQRRSIRADMWTLRNLDFSHFFEHRSPIHHRDLGYGPGSPGKLITLKDLKPDETLGAGSQVSQFRRRIRLGI